MVSGVLFLSEKERKLLQEIPERREGDRFNPKSHEEEPTFTRGTVLRS